MPRPINPDIAALVTRIFDHLASPEGQAQLRQASAEARATATRFRLPPPTHEQLHRPFGPADGSRSWAEFRERRQRAAIGQKSL